MLSSLPDLLAQKFNTYEISESETLVVGVSGGVDSMVLLHGILEIHPSDNVVVAHINHGLRGTESETDELFVSEFCTQHGIRFESVTVDVAELAKTTQSSIEMAGREARLLHFERVRALYQARFVLLAHHLDDSVETILFNLVRGARLRGVRGIDERNGTLLRPLLTIPKSQILTYALEHDIAWREDASNASNDYQRNSLRNKVMPVLESINPQFRNSIWDFAQYARDLDRFLEGFFAVHIAQKELSVSDFSKWPDLLQRTCIEKIYSGEHDSSIGLSRWNIEEVQRFILEANWGTKKQFGKIHLTKKNQTIHWD